MSSPLSDCRYFIENYGTSFATSATLGGLVEQYSVWKSWLTDPRLGGFERDTLARNAQIDFCAKTGLPGPGGAPSAGYDKTTRTLEPLECVGGDSTVSCDANFAQWAATIPQSPVLLDFTLAPISDLITDPDVKAGFELAAKEYIQEQRDAWAAQNKCPPSCGPPGSGSCSAGQDACTCSYGGLAGRMCTGCAPMSVRGTFTDIKGGTHSSTATLKCGEAAEVWSGGVKCDVLYEGSCYAGGEVKCERTNNGNLVATVSQSKCSTYVVEDDDNGQRNHTTGSCGGFDGHSTPPSGVTGGSATVTADDEHKRCEFFPSSRRRRSTKKCSVKAACEFA